MLIYFKLLYSLIDNFITGEEKQLNVQGKDINSTVTLQIECNTDSKRKTMKKEL